jgi:hypothetical protein
LGVRQFVTMHGKPPFGNSPTPEMGLPLLYARTPLFNRA